MGLVALVGLVAACGDDGGTGVVDNPPEVQPFVGTWDAEELTITSDADTSIVFDLFDYNGQFTLNVQPSGTYTASLSFRPDSANLFADSEVGSISVTGDAFTLRPNNGPPATSSYTFLSADRLEFEGPTEFDFNFDQQADPAVLRAVLQRR
jgi:hypothetical protein